MNLNFRLTGNSFVKFDEKNDGNKREQLEESGETSITKTNAPEAKPVTASIQDVLASYAQGDIRVISKVDGIPEINEGVTEFVYKDSEITTYKRKGDLSIQIRGKASVDDVLKQLPAIKRDLLIPNIVSGNDGSNGVNGEIDEKVSQGGTGDCWVLTGVLSLNATSAGKQIIKESIQSNSDGSVTVTFKGLGVSYTITADEIRKHDTDDISGDAYSNGDNDMLVLELATEKLMADIACGKVKLDVPEDSVESKYNKDGSIEGGFAQNMIYYLTGQTADFIYAYKKEVEGLSKDEIFAFLQKAYENGNTALTFGVYGSPHEAKLTDGTPYKLNIDGGHALAITKLTDTTVTFVNPWNSEKEYTMTWEEFAKLGIGMLTATDLSALTGETPTDPDVPDVSGATIYSADIFKDIPQNIIDKFLEPTGFDADGNVIEYALKLPYTDISFDYNEEAIDGTPNLTVALTSVEDGKEVKTIANYYSSENLTKALRGVWWMENENLEYDEDLDMYKLKEGVSLKDLKPSSVEISEGRDIIQDAKKLPEPSGWIERMLTGIDENVYSLKSVETFLSKGVINRFFELKLDSDGSGKSLGYTLKAPYTDIKLASETETQRTYEFSYVKNGVRYIASVEINTENGSYRIMQRKEEC